jgi:hypothetical protein
MARYGGGNGPVSQQAAFGLTVKDVYILKTYSYYETEENNNTP